MGNILTTFLAVLVVMGLVGLGFTIGWLLTGKMRIKRGCGMVPKARGDKETKSHCSLCGSEKICDKEEKKP